jgi:hypothetical protein
VCDDSGARSLANDAWLHGLRLTIDGMYVEKPETWMHVLAEGQHFVNTWAAVSPARVMSGVKFLDAHVSFHRPLLSTNQQHHNERHSILITSSPNIERRLNHQPRSLLTTHLSPARSPLSLQRNINVHSPPFHSSLACLHKLIKRRHKVPGVFPRLPVSHAMHLQIRSKSKLPHSVNNKGICRCPRPKRICCAESCCEKENATRKGIMSQVA